MAEAGHVAGISGSPFPADDRLNDWLMFPEADPLSRTRLQYGTDTSGSPAHDLVELSDILGSSLLAELMDGRFEAVTEALDLRGMTVLPGDALTEVEALDSSASLTEPRSFGNVTFKFMVSARLCGAILLGPDTGRQL